MAIRSNAINENLARTASLPSTTTFSACLWGQISTDRNQPSCFFSFDNSAYDLVWIQTAGDGTTINLYVADGASFPETPIVSGVVGTFYFLAVVKNGNDVTAYNRIITANSLTASSTITLANVNAMDGVRFFRNTDNEWLNGLITAMKIWDGVALSQADLLQESYFYVPIRRDGLWYWNPGFATGGQDWSGSRDFTSTGSLSIEDGPPIMWSPYPYQVVFAAAGGGFGSANLMWVKEA